ncbi:MAG: hypothetical protein B6243_03640 [Anaerolineaceae bacterium 4572_5.2]|nr:MAG: hypothetical protein B6243_03640 [Anaerolineaceae bacterium 4572_5.2]
MKIRIESGLPFVTISLNYRGQQITLDKVLLDTGSMGTIFSADKMDAIDLLPEPDDFIHQIRGVGGSEFVFTKQVDFLKADALQVENFQIEVGAMKYGFDIDGIIGLDFLIETKAIIDFSQLELRTSKSQKENSQ